MALPRVASMISAPAGPAATTARLAPESTASAGISTKMVSGAVMSYAAACGIESTTVVPSMRVMSLGLSRGRTTAFQPVADSL